MKNNKKLIWIVIAVILIAGLGYWYFTKNSEQLTDIPESTSGGAMPGDAGSIDDLPEACQKKFNAWWEWLSTQKGDWYKVFADRATKNKSTVYKEASNHWLRSYNNESGPEYQC